MQRVVTRSQRWRPLFRSSRGITRPHVLCPAITSTALHIVRPFSRSPIFKENSGDQAMITTKLGKFVPSSGNSRLDAKLQGGLRIIREDMTCSEFHDSVWGFVIYRCVEGNDAAWKSMLEQLQRHIDENLEYWACKDLLPFHDLHVIDDKSLYGASIDEVRAHFKAWVPKNLEARLRPDTKATISDVSYLSVDNTPRYNYYLVVDEICLESVDHPKSVDPVVKLVWRDWESPWSPEEKLQGVHAPFHDGITEYWEEDVGWMYMPLFFYVEKYENFHGCSWDDMYVRPPYITGMKDETSIVGHWRQSKDISQKVE